MKCTIHQAPTGNRLTDAQLFQFADVAHLYDGQNPTKPETYQLRAAEVSSWFDEAHRCQLVDALVRYGQRIGASPLQQAAAEKLLDSRSVAVVTGQQAGLLTGPFYSLSKALSAVGLALQFERELERPVVPVFWVASEDHDMAEVDHAYLIGLNYDVEKISLHHQFNTHQMVYHAPLTEAQVEQVLQTVRTALPEMPYKADMLQTLLASWRTGDSLSVWFARLMMKLLERHPIVILDPCLPELRQLVGPVFANTIQQFDNLQENLSSVYAAVAANGYQAEVIRDAANTTVFHVIEGNRYVLEKQGDQFVTRGHGKSMTQSDWAQLALKEPTAFSSNVLLRPVIQDHLLPTLAYVGGPSEIAYHPLSHAVFQTHGRKLPPLILRQRVRVATPGVARTMAAWGLTFDDVKTPSNLVAQHALHDVSAVLQDDMSRIEADVTEALLAFGAKYEAFGPQVNDIVERQTAQHKKLLQKLVTKIYRLAERSRTDDVMQLRRIEHWFWTDGHEQERRLSPINLWAELGLRWFDQLPAWGNYRQPAPYLNVTVD